MSQWLPSSGRQWIVQAVVIALLVGVAYQYATASATARALQIQLDAALIDIEVAETAEEIERERSDLLIAQQDSAQAADTAAVNVAAAVSDATATETDQAIAAALELAEDYPVIRDALILAQTELREEREAREVERSESAAAVFAGQLRERVLGVQLLDERQAADDKDVEQDRALSISMQESEAWERAAKPGMLTQIWKQGRWAALAVAAVVILK